MSQKNVCSSFLQISAPPPPVNSITVPEIFGSWVAKLMAHKLDLTHKAFLSRQPNYSLIKT